MIIEKLIYSESGELTSLIGDALGDVGISDRTEAVESASMMIRTVTFALFCTALCSCYASCIAYSYVDCGSTLGSFTNVSITACNTAEKLCTLIIGTISMPTISIKFTPNQDISHVYAQAFVWFDVPMDLPLNNTDVCKDPNSGVQCPLKKNRTYNYNTTIFVKRFSPTRFAKIWWELRGHRREKIVCLTADIYVGACDPTRSV